MRLRHIQVLVTVAETGSIRAAARKLGQTQPALSKVIRQLEGDLSAPMLTRTPRGVVLTEYGKAVLVRARTVDAEVRRIEHEIAQMRGEREGAVSIGVAPLPSIMILPAVLPGFCAKYPKVEVRISDGIYPTVLPNIREGLIDFAVGPEPPAPASNEIECEPLLETELVVAARAGHPEAKARSMKDLAAARWITLGPAGGPGDLFIAALTQSGLAAPSTTIKSESLGTSLAMVEATDFLCVLPKRLVTHLSSQRRLIALDLQERLPSLKVMLLRRSSVPLTPTANALATLIRRRANIIGRG